MRRVTSLAAATLLIVIATGAGFANEPVELVRTGPGAAHGTAVDWIAVFDDEGRLRQRTFPHVGSRDAVFVEDGISAGQQLDISALRRGTSPAESVVFNGPVSAPHDLGNSYLLARLDGIDLKLDLLVERLVGDVGGPSFVEIELNHDIVALSSGHREAAGGLRWPFRGERRDDDLRIRLELDGERVRSLELARWSELDGAEAFHTLEAGENLADADCFGIEAFYRICGRTLTPNGQGRRFIANGNPELAYAPDSSIELELNLGYLIELDPGFTTITIRTPTDIAFGSFRAFGQFSDTGAAATAPIASGGDE